MRILRLLPIAAIGYVCYANADVLKKNLRAFEKSVDILGTVQTTASGVEMNEIARAVKMHYLETGRLPLNDFSAFLRESMTQASGKRTRDPAADLWGTPFRIERTPKGFRILSAGPDRKWNTPDDLAAGSLLSELGGDAGN